MHKKSLLYGVAVGALVMVAICWWGYAFQRHLLTNEHERQITELTEQLSQEAAKVADLSAQLETAKAAPPTTAPTAAPPAPAQTAEPSPTDTPSPTAEPSAQTAEPAPITVTIPKDAGSREIARILANAGAVDDAAAFDNYMAERGVSRTMPYGEYELPRADMPYADVLKILRGGR